MVAARSAPIRSTGAASALCSASCGRRSKSMMLFGGMMIGRTDLPHLFNMTRSTKSALHVAGMVARYGRDRVRHERGTRLTNGNALIAALALSAQDRGIPLWLEAPIVALSTMADRVTSARVMRDGRAVDITVRKGVILACGGFPGDDALKRRLYPHVAAGSRAPLVAAQKQLRRRYPHRRRCRCGLQWRRASSRGLDAGLVRAAGGRQRAAVSPFHRSRQAWLHRGRQARPEICE